MFSDDGLAAVGTIMSLIQAIVKNIWQAAALSHKTANCKSPCVRYITCFFVHNSLNILFAALTPHIDWAVVKFWIISTVLWKKLRLENDWALNLLIDPISLLGWWHEVWVLVYVRILVHLGLLEIWLLVLMSLLKLNLDRLTDWNTSSVLLLVIKILIISLILHV